MQNSRNPGAVVKKAKAAAVRKQLEDQSRRLEAQLASANQMLGPLIQSHQQVQHLLQQMRPQARKQVFDGAVSPKVPLSPRQISCGPVARRTIHVASTVRSPRVAPVVATVAAPVTVPTVPTVPTPITPIVRSVSIPGHVTPTPSGYPTERIERWSSTVPNRVSQLASVASAVRASAEDGLESQSLKQLQSSNSIGIQTADGPQQEDEELLQKLMLVAEAASVITERNGMLEVKEARDRLQEVLAQGRARNLPKERLAPTERQRRRIHNLYQDLKGHLRIYCRVRPLNNKEKKNKDREALKVDGTKLQVPLTGDMFEFDGVFDMTSSQEDIFDATCDLAQSALDGRNVTVFCYGITGAGKTYTMYGALGADGLTQRMIGEVFRKARLAGENVTISGSMMELYNNYLVDLLRPIDWQGRQNPTLSLRLDKSGSVQVEGLAKEPAMDEIELQAVFHRGLEQRAVAAHAMNAESSRSHVLFTVYVTREVEEGEGQVVSKLHFCDLGGCERLKKTEVEKEDRRLEAIEINKSLSALGDVIEAVAKKKKYIPYRNHKLTQLLQDAIGGGAKALMYVNCSPAHSTIRETANALKLANRAKSIVVTRWSPAAMGAFSLPVRVSCSDAGLGLAGPQRDPCLSLTLSLNLHIPLPELLASLIDLQKPSEPGLNGLMTTLSWLRSSTTEQLHQLRPMTCRVIRVSNLIRGLKVRELEEVFTAQVGPVEKVVVSEGFAQISFGAAKHAFSAVQKYDGSEVAERDERAGERNLSLIPIPWQSSGNALRQMFSEFLYALDECHYRRGDRWLTIAEVQKVKQGNNTVEFKGSIIKVVLYEGEKGEKVSDFDYEE
eukprot:s3635_g2.t3